MRPTWISIPNDLSYIFIYKLPRYFLSSSSQYAFRFRRRSSKLIFKMRQAWISDRNEFNKFLSTSPTKFRVYWLCGLGEVKNRFSRWRPLRPSWISDRNNFSCFYLQVAPTLPTKFQVSWPRRTSFKANG